jgi:hypothetical protein
MGLDTECDLVIGARGDSSKRAAIAAARTTLLAEHLDVSEHDVQEAFAMNGSLGATVAALSKNSGRGLRRFEHLDEPAAAIVAVANGVTDPERPVLAENLFSGFRLRDRVRQP